MTNKIKTNDDSFKAAKRILEGRYMNEGVSGYVYLVVPSYNSSFDDAYDSIHSTEASARMRIEYLDQDPEAPFEASDFEVVKERVI